jgi:hypothetical protein
MASVCGSQKWTFRTAKRYNVVKKSNVECGNILNMLFMHLRLLLSGLTDPDGPDDRASDPSCPEARAPESAGPEERVLESCGPEDSEPESRGPEKGLALL